MTSENPAAPQLIRQSHNAVILSFYTLLLTYILNSILQIPGGGNITVIVFLLLLKIVPLLIFIPGLQRRHLRTHAWLSFVVLLYFVLAVQTAFIEESRVYGVVVTLLLSALFCALIVYIRSYRGYYKTSL